MENKKVLLICLDMDPMSIQGDQHTGAAHLYVRESLDTLSKIQAETLAITRLNSLSKPTIEKFSDYVKLVRLQMGIPQVEPKEFFWGKESEVFNGVIDTLNEMDFIPDVVHSVYWYSGKVGLMIAEKYNIPHIYSVVSLGKVKRLSLGTPLSQLDIDREKTEQIIFNKSKVVFSVCEQEKQNLLKLYPGNEEKKVIVIGRGVDPNLFKPQTSNSGPFCNYDQPYLLFVGRLIPSKGLPFLMRVYLRLIKEETLLTKPRLLIAGGNPTEVNESKSNCLVDSELVKEYKKGNIRWLGIVPRIKMPALYSKALITCIPSIYDPAARVVLESMACGTPVIMTETGYSNEIVKSGVNGYVAPYGDELLWTEYIRTMIRNPTWSRKLASRTRESVIPFFSMDDFSERQSFGYRMLWSEYDQQPPSFTNKNLTFINEIYPGWEVPSVPQRSITTKNISDWCSSLGFNVKISEMPVSSIASSRIFYAKTDEKSYIVKQPKPKMLFYKMFYPSNPESESEYRSTHSRWFAEQLFSKRPLFREPVALNEKHSLLLFENCNQPNIYFDLDNIKTIFRLVKIFQQNQSERFSYLYSKNDMPSGEFKTWDDFWEYDAKLNRINSYFRGGESWFTPAQAEIELQRCNLALSTGIFPIQVCELKTIIKQNHALLELISNSHSKLTIVWGECRPGHCLRNDEKIIGIDAESCCLGQAEIDFAHFLWWFIDLRNNRDFHDNFEVVTNLLMQMNKREQKYTLAWLWLTNLFWLWWDISRSRKDRICNYLSFFSNFENWLSWRDDGTAA